MSSQTGDFYGIEFEVDFSIFDESFEDIPAVYVIYNSKTCLEVSETNKLKAEIETHPHTREWLKLSGKDSIFVAFHFDDDQESRDDKVRYLKNKLKPQIKNSTFRA